MSAYARSAQGPGPSAEPKPTAPNRNDIVFRIIGELSAERRASLMQCMQTTDKAEFTRMVLACTVMMWKRETSMEGVSESKLPLILSCTRLYLCWRLSQRKFWTDEEFPNSALRPMARPSNPKKAKQTEQHIVSFYVFLRRAFERPGAPSAAPVSGRQTQAAESSQVSQPPTHIGRQAHHGPDIIAQRDFSTAGSAPIQPAIINIDRAASHGAITVPAHIAHLIKDHQVDGLRFMWKEVVENRQGCLISQGMGLGKTMQTVTLLLAIGQAAHSNNPVIGAQIPNDLKQSRTLVLCPPGLIDHWMEQLDRWLPGDAPDFMGWRYAIRASEDKTGETRRMKVLPWVQQGGVLIVGFDTYKNMVTNCPTGRCKTIAELTQMHNEMRPWLLEVPTLVIMDEAHRIKNPKTLINDVVSKLSTRNRIALTGTPLANNLSEYYNILEWVAPGHFGSQEEFDAEYLGPIQRGLYADSVDLDYKLAVQKLSELQDIIHTKVHRADQSVLHNQLKEKSEFLLFVPLTALQRRLYEVFVDHQRRRSKSGGPIHVLSIFNMLGLICASPKFFMDRVTEGPKKPKGDDGDEVVLSELFSKLELESQKAIYQKIFAQYPDSASDFSHKIHLVKKILDLCQKAGEKVLVFSHSLRALDALETIVQGDKRSYQRLDGSVQPEHRRELIDAFNNDTGFGVFLISTKAGAEGLNIQSASRVVIFDTKFNPQDEGQAISRAYRLGQEKAVFVYRFIVGGTLESHLLNTHVFKRQLAMRVLDGMAVERAGYKAEKVLYKPFSMDQEDLTAFRGRDPLVLDKLLSEPNQGDIVSIEDLRELQETVEGA